MPNNNPHGHNQYTKRDQTSKPTQPPHGGEHHEHHKGGEHTDVRPPDPAQSGNNSGADTAGGTPKGTASGTSRRGFASMDEATQREIASKGGHSQGRENNPGNFANDRDKAREAGRKGGEAHGARHNGVVQASE